jgi:hypothetical protein
VRTMRVLAMRAIGLELIFLSPKVMADSTFK